jgi:hypothetical protein
MTASSEQADVSRAPDAVQARERRARAARRCRPAPIKTLLVAQAPPGPKPGEPERYFYFEDVDRYDDLFRGVVRALVGRYPTRAEKPRFLAQLRDRGYYMIDLKLDPIGVGPMPEACVKGAIRRARRLAPGRIVLIKTDVYDLLFSPMRAGGLPVVDVRMPFPGSGNQLVFDEKFKQALGKRPPRPKRG